MTRKIHSTERIGVLAVAAISLAVTAAGALMAWCKRPVEPPGNEEVHILAYADSAMILSADSAERIAALPDSVRRRIRIEQAQAARARQDSLKKKASSDRRHKRDSLRRARRKAPRPTAPRPRSWRSPLDETL